MMNVLIRTRSLGVCLCFLIVASAFVACGDDGSAPLCQSDTCSGHGSCDESTGVAVCACETGYTGLDCSSCAAGYQDDGSGACVPAVTCQAGSCSGHGTCDDSSGAVVCTCDTGYQGDACDACAAGYQDDGSGNCVEAVTCQADSCSGHGTCDDSSGAVVCTCDTGYQGDACDACAPGYQDDGSGNCVEAVTCQAGSCSGHGTCDDSSGAVVCTCDTGYQGDACDACAAGYHDDGSGTCVPDGQAHPAGWSDPAQHGAAAKEGDMDCRSCHGADLTGDGDAGSCDACHAAGWRTDCVFCHGGTDNQTGAPPVDLGGLTDSAEQTVGAHTAHVTGTNHMTYDCDQCHLKPVDVLSAGHMFDATPGVAEVLFDDGLSAAAAYDGQGCSSLYCHGNGQGDNGSVASHTGVIDNCTACHPAPPNSGQHQRGAHVNRECRTCHNAVAGSGNAITGPELHVNGVKDVELRNGGTWNAATGSCNPSCHGAENW